MGIQTSTSSTSAETRTPLPRRQRRRIDLPSSDANRRGTGGLVAPPFSRFCGCPARSIAASHARHVSETQRCVHFPGGALARALARGPSLQARGTSLSSRVARTSADRALDHPQGVAQLPARGPTCRTASPARSGAGDAECGGDVVRSSVGMSRPASGRRRAQYTTGEVVRWIRISPHLVGVASADELSAGAV
jgi:hypothetical protein